MNYKIPNLNTISCLIDRLIIERVKQAQMDERLKLREEKGLRQKIETQKDIAAAIKIELEKAIEEILIKGNYEYYGEARTFEDV